jgi:3',5'-cyclic AMP phosphodiesterase CpdA
MLKEISMAAIRSRSLALGAACVLLTTACSGIICRPISPQRADPPAPAAGALLHFAVYGDTRSCHPIHRKIVEDVLIFHPTFILQTGDLVANGRSTADWKTFNDITADLRRQVQYYPALGNHDNNSGGNFERAVSQPVSPADSDYYSFDKGNLHFVAIDTEQPVDSTSAQGQWLESDLTQAQADKKFIIPFFHKAMFSIGQHAVDADVVALRPILHPLFRRHGVRLAFEGHDHVYYRTLRDGITYVVTGGGGAPLYKAKHSELRRPKDVFESVNHFCVVDVFADHIEVTAYRHDLTQLDQFRVDLPKDAG